MDEEPKASETSANSRSNIRFMTHNVGRIEHHMPQNRNIWCSVLITGFRMCQNHLSFQLLLHTAVSGWCCLCDCLCKEEVGGGGLIKEVINQREQCQRAITLPLSKHCSRSRLISRRPDLTQTGDITSSLKIITEITLQLSEVNPANRWLQVHGRSALESDT